MSDEGYLISWAKNSHGVFYNAYAPKMAHAQKRKHIEASYDRAKVKAACEAHLAKMRQAA